MTFWKKWFQPPRDQPTFVQQYLQAFEQKTKRKTPLEQLRFVVFDTETTGLDPYKAQLLSLGAVVVQAFSLRVQESLELNAHAPGTEVSEQIAIHGITRRRLQAGIDEEQILKYWLEFIQDGILVAHHAAFDMAIINQLSKKYYGIKLKNPVLDTAYLAKRLEHGTQLDEYIRPEDYSLDQLCERYNIEPNDRHTAAGDAFITSNLLLKLLAKARKSGIRTYGDLIR